MEGIGLATLGWIIAVCLIGGLSIGYLLGHFRGRGKAASRAAEQAAKAHDEYRDEVREHFEQTSQIMSRMVDDYREMYRHMSDGAGKLANIHPERVVTPPPAPEAITEKDAGTERETAEADTADAVASAGEDDKARARRLSGNPT